MELEGRASSPFWRPDFILVRFSFSHYPAKQTDLVSNFLAPAAAGPLASLFVCSYSSGICHRAIPTSPAAPYSPIQAFILGRQLNLLFYRKQRSPDRILLILETRNILRTYLLPSTPSASAQVRACLLLSAPSHEPPNFSSLCLWPSGFCTTFHAAPRITFLRYRSHPFTPLLQILECLCFVP